MAVPWTAKGPSVKVTRATKCSLKFATRSKRDELARVLAEYGRVVNFFIGRFWDLDPLPTKNDLNGGVYNAVESWLGGTMRQTAAREAIGMINAAKKRWGPSATMPVHKGRTMRVSTSVAKVKDGDGTGFDLWVSLTAIAADKSVKIALPVRRHKHLNRLAKQGRMQGSFVISTAEIQFSFEIETGEKTAGVRAVGVDTGINALATLSTGEQRGRDVKACIERVKRCKVGSQGQKRAIRALKQRIDETAKRLASDPRFDLIVVERLRALGHRSKVRRRLTKNIRRSIGAWNWRYWLTRLEAACQMNCVRLRTVEPAYTSQICNGCGYLDRGNRNGEAFRCRKCGHADNADINAAKNILSRFLVGPYGADYKGVVSPNVSAFSARPC